MVRSAWFDYNRWTQAYWNYVTFSWCCRNYAIWSSWSIVVMKIMKSQLKRIIKEELAFLREEEEVDPEAIDAAAKSAEKLPELAAEIVAKIGQEIESVAAANDMKDTEALKAIVGEMLLEA